MNLRVGDYVTWKRVFEKPISAPTGEFRYVGRVDEIKILNGEVSVDVTRLCGKTASLRIGEFRRCEVALAESEGWANESVRRVANPGEAVIQLKGKKQAPPKSGGKKGKKC